MLAKGPVKEQYWTKNIITKASTVWTRNCGFDTFSVHTYSSKMFHLTEFENCNSIFSIFLGKGQIKIALDKRPSGKMLARLCLTKAPKIV